MDNEQAKFILQGYRPGGQDAEDPEVLAALEQAKHDSELGRWLEENIATDRAISQKLRECAVPYGLRETIIAGGRLARPNLFWRRPSVLAVAAAFAVLIGITIFAPPQTHAQPVDSFAAEYVAGLTKLSHPGNSLDDLKPFLRGRKVDCPPGLKALGTVGCCEGYYEGKHFSIICFKAEEEGLRPEVHLLVFDRTDLPDLPSQNEPMVSEQGDWVIACWSKGDLSYVMARVGKKESVRDLL
ncbi:MAG: hypothetical protein ACPGVU_02330 [Limisphaerales bacterium]